MADIAALTHLIEPEIETLGFALVRVKMIGGKTDPTLQIMAEDPATRQLNIDECATISRRLSELLDEVDPIKAAYRLEISSPGIDRPLTRLADFADWTGHQARINLLEAVDGRKQLKGKLAGCTGQLITIDVDGADTKTVDFSNIHAAKLILTDKLIKETTPLSTEGAELIKEEG
jgi:ribosome maturation factor RimP